ncbi:unnamed protein product [Caenorhabditis auriculariae]|uniref:Glutathione S-transferase n=1 Tax=Caenorhabditis auriculariae TaxID=2777116 RepID=A0A8S1GSE7_9PELO|nr:unnamed protein product [Caenorhabditis auriculariae]
MYNVAMKLTYFNCRGLGEMIRLLLTDKQIPFEDERFGYADWPSYKPKMQFGQVPCLYVEDEQIVQTGAIMRHLGRAYGLNGHNEQETTFIDMFFEGIRDLHTKYAHLIYGDFENGKEPFIKDVLPVELEKLEKLFKTYSNGELFIAGPKESYADYALFEELDVLLVLSHSALDHFPALKSFHERFSQRSNLKVYLSKRAALNVPINGNGKTIEKKKL